MNNAFLFICLLGFYLNIFSQNDSILVKKLDQLSFLNQVEIILIENQPSLKNPIMKSIQMIQNS